MINTVKALCGSAAFAKKNWFVNLEEALVTTRFCFTAVQCIGLFVNFGLNMGKVKAFHLALQQFIDEDMHYSNSYLILF